MFSFSLCYKILSILCMMASNIILSSARLSCQSVKKHLIRFNGLSAFYFAFCYYNMMNRLEKMHSTSYYDNMVEISEYVHNNDCKFEHTLIGNAFQNP